MSCEDESLKQAGPQSLRISHSSCASLDESQVSNPLMRREFKPRTSATDDRWSNNGVQQRLEANTTIEVATAATFEGLGVSNAR